MRMAASGELQKLTITAYEEEDYQTGQVGEPFEVMLNPESYSQKFGIKYNDDQKEQGKSGKSKKFKNVDTSTIDLKLLFDGTGIVPGVTDDVSTQLATFKEKVYTYNGNTHEPNFLVLFWGIFLFKGRLTSLTINYTLFGRDGKPLRAEVDASFVASTDNETLSKEAGRSSPDLTHIRIVREGDTLPLMAYKIYGDTTYCAQVAQSNGLDSFREIKPGTKINFPPLK